MDSFERVGHHVPLGDRWGGWYVTGGHEKLRHMGNAIASRSARGVELSRDDAVGEDGLSHFFDTSKYPIATSDVTALLVLDHQVSMHFKLMEASYIMRQAIHDAGWIGKEVPLEQPEQFVRAVKIATEQVVNHLLFADEVSMGGGRVAGDGVFVKSFLAGRVSDSKGRSLRDFKLEGRMFAYRCSYMIYSRSFTGLPEVLKKSIYRSLHEVLASKLPVKGYDYMVPGERAAILEILNETVPGFKEAV